MKKKKKIGRIFLIPGFLRENSKLIQTENFSCGTGGGGRVRLSAPINLL